jgi:hypothetical protein
MRELPLIPAETKHEILSYYQSTTRKYYCEQFVQVSRILKQSMPYYADAIQALCADFSE